MAIKHDERKLRQRNLDAAGWSIQQTARNQWGSFDEYSGDNGVISMGVFGDVPKELVCRVRIEDIQRQLLELQDQVSRRCDAIAGLEQRDSLWADSELLDKIESFRLHIGAIQHQLRIQMTDDLVMASTVVGRMWRCFWQACVKRNLSPEKYHAICGSPHRGYGTFVSQLVNIPPDRELRDRILQKYGVSTWKEYMDRVWQSENQLMELEKEYRDTTLAISQVGLGVGGMYVGVIGLAISFLITLLGSG